MTDLTKAQIPILKGLDLSGGSMVSVSEMPEVEVLQRAGYVEPWAADGGFLAWGITDAGRTVLAALNERGGGNAT